MIDLTGGYAIFNFHRTRDGSRSGDKDFVALVAPESCSAWQAAADALGPIKLRFHNPSGQALVLGDGNALAKVKSCDESVTRLVIQVDKGFNIGMPPT